MEITIGWWLLPLLITITTWVYTIVRNASYTHSGTFFDIDIAGLYRFACSVIVTLVVWLVYFIIF